MFALTLAVAAATLALPVPDSGFERTIEIAASREVRDSGLVGMWYEVFVAPDGTIEGCTVRAAVGDGTAAQAVCKALVGKKAEPAVGSDGQPAYGYARGTLNFADNLAPMSADAIEPDVTISARGLDSEAERVGVTVLVGTDGKVAACEPGAGAGGLWRTACSQVRSMALPIRKAKGGASVNYLYPLIVEFRAERG